MYSGSEEKPNDDIPMWVKLYAKILLAFIMVLGELSSCSSQYGLSKREMTDFNRICDIAVSDSVLNREQCLEAVRIHRKLFPRIQDHGDSLINGVYSYLAQPLMNKCFETLGDSTILQEAVNVGEYIVNNCMYSETAYTGAVERLVADYCRIGAAEKAEKIWKDELLPSLPEHQDVYTLDEAITSSLRAWIYEVYRDTTSAVGWYDISYQMYEQVIDIAKYLMDNEKEISIQAQESGTEFDIENVKNSYVAAMNGQSNCLSRIEALTGESY